MSERPDGGSGFFLCLHTHPAASHESLPGKANTNVTDRISPTLIDRARNDPASWAIVAWVLALACAAVWLALIWWILRG